MFVSCFLFLVPTGSPHEIAMLKSVIKLTAMTFEYVRAAYGQNGQKVRLN